MSYWISLLPNLAKGFGISLNVYVVTLIVSMPIGLILGYISNTRPFIQKILSAYSWLFRGSPLLLQLYFVFYALPLILPIPLRDNRLFFAIITFILNYSAYFQEIFKGGFKTIGKGQWDAAKMLNISKINAFRYIIIPQVMRNTLYSISNECITLVKDTSLLAAVALPEMLMVAKEAVSRDLRVDALVLVGVGYLLFTALVVFVINIISKKLNMKGTSHDSI
ncbi:hypothetical protein AOC36_03205 [Erysipelothrix larvae]|uniref:ABC transmembrane type-1 domain-containing protein n=1 Tax=Erysipelothrix larvae TaxID=1514105 RepID=A0A0X8GYZ4_9FIRM|nr:amino acid ABC transporter permease [Erysipelothrix larvae]AMC93023.1 hypothetical protein AOC36_03205 [Erysipelothrix larvae]